MAIKKRNKIWLQLSSAENVNQQFSQGIKEKTKLEFNDEDDLVHNPIIIKKKAIVSNNKLSNMEICFDNAIIKEDHPEYSNIYKSKIKETIMNMEDLENNDDIDEDIIGSDDQIPSKEEIDKIMKKKLLLRNKINMGSEKVKENDYVKLLDEEDKLEILGIIDKNGGIQKNNNKDNSGHDFELGEFEDERLAVSSTEKVIEMNKRKEMIEHALNNSHDTTASALFPSWENQLLSLNSSLKGRLSNNLNFSSYNEIPPPLPRLADQTGIYDFREIITDKQNELSTRRKQLKNQLDVLTKQKIANEVQLHKLIQSLSSL